MLITTSEALAKSVQEELPRQLAALPRQEIAAASLENNGAILLAEDLDTAFDLANRIAPEHLELSIADAFSHIWQGGKRGRVLSWGTILPNRWATILQAPTMCCRPPARRASSLR